MGLWPITGDEKRLGSATTLCETVALSFVIPSEAEGSAVPRTFRGNTESRPATELSSRPERTRISYYAGLTTSTYAPFRKERRMRIANANKFDRKSGGAEWRDLRFLLFLRSNPRPRNRKL
jgi:hypothetical protein